MKKIYYISVILLCVFLQTANAQMAVNSTGAAPTSSAMLDVQSTNKGFLMPRLTTTQRNAIASPTLGLMIYNISTGEIDVYQGVSGWKTASRLGVPFLASGSIALGGNGIIEASNTSTGDAIKAYAGTASGVYSMGGATGVYGTTMSLTGTGIYGETNTYRGVWGRGLTTGDGVYGDATTGKGVYGLTSSTGIGVYGNAISGGVGVQGESNTGDGGYFKSTSGKGLTATSSSNSAIYADNTSATAPVAQFANLSGGTALSVVAQTAIDIAGGIRVSGAASTRTAFKITTSASNTAGHVLTIPNTTLANNSTDILLITHAFGTYLAKPFGVYWTGSNWGIYVEDLTAMPIGTVFNVLVIKQ